MYDGSSFAKNQDVVFVSFNYRTNVFGFPKAPDISISRNNLGFLDQNLALAWVQDNIAQFGGDKSKVTIMVRTISRDAWGHVISDFRAGRANLQGLHQSHVPSPPGIRLPPHFVRASCYPARRFPHPGLLTSRISTRLRLRWDVSSHQVRSVCGACAKSQLPLYGHIRTDATVAGFLMWSTSYAFYPGPRGGAHVIRSVTAFGDPLQRIRAGQFARVPILLGNMEDDGTVFAHDKSNLSTFLKKEFGRHASRVPPSLVRSLYPGLTDPEVIAAVERDMKFRWCVAYWLDIKGNNN
jgi:hypothetical protein